jgi:hypothetical protein
MAIQLQEAISAVQTIIKVEGGIEFPQGGVIQIESEIMSYTSCSENEFRGLTRAVGGTSAATHAKGKTITSVTAAGPDLVLKNDVVVIQGSAVPTDGVTGALFAGPGSLYVRVSGSNSNAYINANTKASPTWKLITRAA